jgi:hypothetical protein
MKFAAAGVPSSLRLRTQRSVAPSRCQRAGCGGAAGAVWAPAGAAAAQASKAAARIELPDLVIRIRVPPSGTLPHLPLSSGN